MARCAVPAPHLSPLSERGITHLPTAIARDGSHSTSRMSDAPASLPHTDRLGAPWCCGVSSAIGAGPAGLSDLHLLGRLGKGQGRLAPNIQPGLACGVCVGLRRAQILWPDRTHRSTRLTRPIRLRYAGPCRLGKGASCRADGQTTGVDRAVPDISVGGSRFRSDGHVALGTFEHTAAVRKLLRNDHRLAPLLPGARFVHPTNSRDLTTDP